MNIVEKTEGRLVLREKPWLVLAVGGVFIATGIAMAIRTGEAMAAGFAVLGAFLILAFGNTVTATFDRNVGRFTRSTRGLVRNSEVTHPLSEIAGASSEASRSGKPSRGYRVALTLLSGARVPLTMSYSSGKKSKEQTAAAIRTFLSLPQSPEVKIPGFGDMVRLMFDPDPAQRLGEMYGGPVSEYEEILRADPDNLDARRQLGLALAMQNKPREATEQFEAARDLAVRRGNRALAAEIDDALARMNDAARRG